MTGGLAWIYDAEQTMIVGERYHTEFLEAVPFADAAAEAQAALKALVSEHVALTGSVLGQRLLAEWEDAARKFVLLTAKPQ
jgi:glutamate synthase domain-containing protein 3